MSKKITTVDNEELVREHAAHIEAVCSDLQLKLDEIEGARESLEAEIARLGAAHKVLTESLPEA